jgi:hypothetical protein
MSVCWPEHSVVMCECRASSRISGANFMASGRVPTTHKNFMTIPCRNTGDHLGLPVAPLEHDPIRLNQFASLTFCLRMILSENRFPLFGIMR